jgi:hypothetical protein
MKEFFDQLEKITDILNVGRVVFYPVAGVLVVLPIFMIFELLKLPSSELPRYVWINPIPEKISISFGLTLFILSLAVGFLIAIAGFCVVIQRLSPEVSEEVSTTGPKEYSFAYNYPFLSNKKGADYAAWLLSEYYRYLEIAIFVPLGAVIGLALLEAYLIIFVAKDFLNPSSAGFTQAQAMLILILGLLLWITQHGWEKVWERRVIKPTLAAYQRAKQLLIEGAKDKPAVGAEPSTKG